MFRKISVLVLVMGMCLALLTNVAFADVESKPIFVWDDASIDQQWNVIVFSYYPEYNPFSINMFTYMLNQATLDPFEIRDESVELTCSSKSLYVKGDAGSSIPEGEAPWIVVFNNESIEIPSAAQSVSVWIKVLSGEGTFRFQVDETPKNMLVCAREYELETFDSWEAVEEKDGWKRLRFDVQNWQDSGDPDYTSLKFPIQKIYLAFMDPQDIEVLIGPVTYEVSK